MADPRDPIGEIIRNLIMLQRLGNGAAADVSALIEDLFEDIIAQIARVDPTAPGADRYRRARAEKVLGAIEAQVSDAFDDIVKQVRQTTAEVGVHQAKWATSMLEASVGAVAVDISPGRLGVNMMKAIIDRDPMQGLLLRDWFTGQSDATVKRVRRQVQLGMVQNETLDDIVRRVRGRAVGRGNYIGGVLQTTTREANALVRTAINDIANTAHMETWRENSDVAPQYQIVATLDSRTTPICRARDGEIHKVEDDGPRPPFHIGCRTVTVPVIDWKGMGIDPPEPGMRASADGPVPADTNYDEWLRRQSVAKQEEILGKERAKLFREKDVSLREMVRNDGTQIRISELMGGPPGPPTPPVPPSPAVPPPPPPMKPTAAWGMANGVAKDIRLFKGAKEDGILTIYREVLEVDRRFGLAEPLALLGHPDKMPFKVKWDQGTAAGYAPKFDALLFKTLGTDAAAFRDTFMKANALANATGSLNPVKFFVQTHGDPRVLPILNTLPGRSHSVTVELPHMVWHEMGHRVWYRHPDSATIQKLSQTAFQGGWQYTLGNYAAVNVRELWAESFSAYMQGTIGLLNPEILDWLVKHDAR